MRRKAKGKLSNSKYKSRIDRKVVVTSSDHLNLTQSVNPLINFSDIIIRSKMGFQTPSPHLIKATFTTLCLCEEEESDTKIDGHPKPI